MNLNQLYYFTTVAKVEHFRYAAELLNISQPSLSYAISSLETELGIPLFEKQGRNVSLTKYGKIFLGYVTTALDTLDEGKKQILHLTNEHTGHIDIVYVSPLASHYIPQTVRHFLDQPHLKGHEITFTFKQAFTSHILEGLKSATYDIGFCSYVEDEPLIHFEPICKQELIAIVPPKHPLSHFDKIDLKQLEPYPFVSYAKESGLGKITRNLFKEAQFNPHIICEGEDETALLGLVSQGFGVSVIAKTEALDYITVPTIHLNHPDPTRTLYLAYMKNKHLPPITTTFIEYVKNHTLLTLTNTPSKKNSSTS